MMTHSAVAAIGAVPSTTRIEASGATTAISRAQFRLTDAGTDDQARAARREVPQRDDRLARLAEAHVVGEDGAAPAQQERDAFDLVRKEPIGERDRALEGRIRIAGQLEQLCERRSLRVERVGHDAAIPPTPYSRRDRG